MTIHRYPHPFTKSRIRNKTIVLLVILLAVFIVLHDGYRYDYADFGEYLASWTSLQTRASVMAVICGMMLALAGVIYQNVFHNPMAAPSMLGVNTGIRLGFLILAFCAMDGTLYAFRRFGVCYIAGMGMFALIFFLGRLASGKRHFAVTDMLLVSLAINQIVNMFVTILSSSFVDAFDPRLVLYNNLCNGDYVEMTAPNMIVLLVSAAIGLIPMYLMQFSFNTAAYTREEARGMGIRMNVLQIVSLLIATYSFSVGIAFCGEVGMLALVVPHASRYLFGAEFGKQFWGNLLLGGIVLLLCQKLLSPFFTRFYWTQLPMWVTVNMIVLPLFVITIFLSQRGWE